MTPRIAAAGCIAVILIVGNVWGEGAPPAAEPPTDRPLTLEESIRIAFQNHGDIGVAQEQWVGAKQRVIATRALLFPQIETTFSFQRNNLRRIGQTLTQQGFVVGSITSHTLTHRYETILSQTIWDMNRTRTLVRQAKAGVLGAEAGIGLARTTVAFDVANAYFEQLRREKLLALAKQQVEQAKKHLEMVQAQVDAGMAARIDLNPVRVELKQAEFNLVSAENNARIAATNFRNALGLDRGPALKLEDVPDEVPSSVGSLEDYIAQALRWRPDLAQVRASVQQAEASLTLAKINARPQASITGSYTYGLGDSPTQRQLFLLGSLTIPIFSAGALQADVAEARANLESNRIRLRQLTKDVAANVEAAYSNLVSAVERITAAKALVESAQENLAAANEKYRLGVGIALEIVDAQIQFFSAQNSAAEALYDYHIAKANLDRAIGVWAAARGQAQLRVRRPVTGDQ
ncbi:MAG: TolC family protein [Abditibacteriales bacterium]|nr:TolC family protein [Abditibacteriales bacterium]MDW8367594.1 TolC family protein [Abditibacteriales bacterium]